VSATAASTALTALPFGLILAGGQGTRMGGVDKGLVHLDGQAMIAHVAQRLRPQVSALAINANRSADAYAAYGYPVVADDVTGFAGPLAGVAAGLRYARTQGAAWMVTAPCDSPYLPLDVVARLCAAIAQDATEIAVARTADGAQPVFALYATSLLESLLTFLGSGKRKIDAWTAMHAVSQVDFANAAAFANINSPEELAQHASDKRNNGIK
jgi:molybdenum cofactor guanylyltransferase